MAVLPLLLLLASVGAHAAAGPFVTDGDRVPPHSIRVTTLGSGSPDVRRHQARSKDARELMRLGEFLLNRIGTNCSACMQVASGFLIELGNGDKFIWDLGSGSYVRYACMHGMPLLNPELQRAGVGCSNEARALMHHCLCRSTWWPLACPRRSSPRSSSATCTAITSLTWPAWCVPSTGSG